MKLTEKTLNEKYAYKGRIINLRVDTVELPDKHTSTREIVEHNGGIGIIPVDDEGNTYIVEQWRSPYKKVLFEIPAGKRDGDEDTLLGGKRELKEEIGATAKEWIDLGELYPSPGYCGEIIHLYLARGLEFSEQDLDEGEFLNVHKLSLDELVEKIMNNEIGDAKTMAAALKAQKYLSKNVK